MTDLNQGASIEAERACLLVKELDRIAMSLAADLVAGAVYTFQGHDYLDRESVMERVVRWRIEWNATSAGRAALLDAARRTPAAAAGAGELPPLPKPAIGGHALLGQPEYFTAEQYREGQRAAIAADRAQRKQAVLQEISDIGQEIEAWLSVKTWREHLKEKVRASGDEADPQMMMEALHAEISDLRTQLAAAHHVGKHMFDALAAPASAQPADPRLEVFIDWYLREGKRSEIHPNGHVERTTRAHILAWLDSKVGAQPDQRESAADGWQYLPVQPTDDMIVAFAEQWFSKVRPIDDCGMEDCYAAMLAAAPYPAAQSAKDAERLDHIEKHAVRGATYKGITSVNVIVHEDDLAMGGVRYAIDCMIERAAIQPRQGQDSANNSATGEKA